MKRFLFLILITCTSSIFSQSPEWVNYTNGDYVLDISENNGNIWVATVAGLMKYNTVTAEKEFFNKGNTLFPSNCIQSIEFINDNTYWIGTVNGLVYVTGSSWIVYNSDNSGIPDNLINVVKLDNNGTLWIGTGNGLVTYDGIDWTIYNTANSELPNNYINDIKIASNNAIWVGTGAGIVQIDGNNWTVYTSSNSGLQNDLISSIAIEDTNLIWAGAYAYYSSSPSVYKFDGNSWVIIPASNLSVYGIDIDSQGNKYLGMNYFDPAIGSGLYIIPAGMNTVNFLFAPTESGGWVSTVFIDNNNFIWLGTSRGLVKYGGSHTNTSNSGLTKNNINQVYIDINQNKWFCSTGWIPLSGNQYQIGSITKYDGVNWQTFTANNSIIDVSGARCFAGDNSGIIYAALEFQMPPPYGNPLVKYDGTSWVSIDVPQTQYDQINYMLYDRDTLWAYFEGGYLYTYQNGNWTQITSFPGNYVNTIVRTGDRHLFGCSNGLYVFDGNTWSVYNTSNSGLPNNKVTSISVDSQTNLWITTFGGLAKYDGVNWEVFNSSNSPIVNDQLSSIAIDENDIIYFGSINTNYPTFLPGDGLVKKDGDQWAVFNTGNSGFPSAKQSFNTLYSPLGEYDNIYSLAIDSLNRIWIATDGGVGVYDKDGIPVPVELISFSASIVEDYIMIKWETATELNNQGFEIQRKVAGIESNWEILGFVEGKGTTTAVQSYSFVDKYLRGSKIYYRLKQIDYDGSFIYSNIDEIHLNKNYSFKLEQNYPNPFNPSTKIDFTIPYDISNSKTILRIYNIQGKLIRTLIDEVLNSGYHSKTWDGKNDIGFEVSSGVYFYDLQVAHRKASGKMMLLR